MAPGLTYLVIDQAGAADGNAQHIRLLRDGGQVGRARVADGHRGIGVEQQQRQWQADDRAAPDDDGASAGQLHGVVLEQAQAAQRRGWHKGGSTFGEAAEVERVQPVDVAGGIEGVDDLGDGDASGQRREQEDAVHVGVRAQLCELVAQGAGCGRRLVQAGGERVALEGTLDGAGVGAGGSVGTLHQGEAGWAGEALADVWQRPGQAGPDGVGDGSAEEQAGGHKPSGFQLYVRARAREPVQAAGGLHSAKRGRSCSTWPGSTASSFQSSRR